MLKEMIQKIEDMAAPKTIEVDGKVYCNKDMKLVDVKKTAPHCIDVNGLDSICKLVRNEAGRINLRIFVQVERYNEVAVFTTYDEDFDRHYLYRCTADTPNVTMGRFMSYENAVIEIRSLYIPNEDTQYLLSLLSSISNESKVTSTDNGVTQKVEAKQGIALSSMVEVKPRVSLKPFRTFIEVEQPESEFLLRINGDGGIGLFQADGGVWKLEATRNVASYFENELKDLIESGQVVIIR